MRRGTHPQGQDRAKSTTLLPAKSPRADLDADSTRVSNVSHHSMVYCRNTLPGARNRDLIRGFHGGTLLRTESIGNHQLPCGYQIFFTRGPSKSESVAREPDVLHLGSCGRAGKIWLSPRPQYGVDEDPSHPGFYLG